MSQHEIYHTSTTAESARISWMGGTIFSRKGGRRIKMWLCGMMAVMLGAAITTAQEVAPEQPAADAPTAAPQDAPTNPAQDVPTEAPAGQDRIDEILAELAAELAKETPDEAKITALQQELEQITTGAAAATAPQPPVTAEAPAATGMSAEMEALWARLEAAMIAHSEESAKNPESEKVKALEKEIEEINKQIETLSFTEAPPAPAGVVTPPPVEAPIVPAPVVPAPVVPVQPVVVEPTPPAIPAPTAEPTIEPKLVDKPEIKNAAPPGPDDVIKLTLRDNMIDINYLLELIGKEMGFIFLYDAVPPATNVRIQQYGDLHRRDLLPLLESLLRFNGYGFVREDPFIRIVQIGQAVKKTEIKIESDEDLKSLAPGDMIVVQIIELEHVPVAQLQGVLTTFTSEQGVITPVPTNPNMMIITEYARRMPRLQELIDLMDQPGPARRLEVTDVKYVVAADAATQLSNLIRDLGEYTATTSPMQSRTPGRTRPRQGQPAQPGQPQPGQPQPAPAAAPTATGPVMHVDERTNRLFTIGTDEQIEQVLQLLTLLDVKAKDAVIIKAFVMKEVVPSDIGQQIVSLLEAIGEDEEDQVIPGGEGAPQVQPQQQRTPRTTTSRSRMSQMDRSLMQAGTGGPFLLGDDRTNRLIVVGRPSQIEKIQELLDLLDVPAAVITGAHIVVYTLKNVEAAEAEEILNALEVTRSTERPNARERARSSSRQGSMTQVPGQPGGQVMAGEVQGLPTEEDFEVRTAIQESTNRLFVLATNKQHEQIANIIEKVDMEAPEDMGAIQVYFLENRDPEEVASMLESLLESEKRDDKGQVNVPGKEGAPIVVALADIYAVAVRASAKQHDNIRNLIAILDKRLPQVLVEAILVQVNADDAMNLGVSLQNAYGAVGNTNASLLSPFGVANSTLSLPGASGIVAGSGGTLAFYNDTLVHSAIEALETEGKGKVVSMPRILVNDNEEGSIDSKREEPTTKTTVPPGSDTPIIEFAGYEDAGTTLKITPHISEGDFLKLEITLSVNSFLGESSGNVPPPKSTNEISTMVTVPNNTTIVLGGLTTETTGTTVNQIPLLGNIPVAGALFRNVSYSQNKNVLYVFVKANIVRSEEASFKDLDTLSEKHRKKLRELEMGYKNLPIIPGIEPDVEEQHSVLDEDY